MSSLNHTLNPGTDRSCLDLMILTHLLEGCRYILKRGLSPSTEAKLVTKSHAVKGVIGNNGVEVLGQHWQVEMGRELWHEA